MNPYTLPEGNVQIAFSGGRTSGFMLHNLLEANGGLPDRAKVIFTNTGREMPETLDFVQECSERWNVPITWLEYRRDGNKNSYEVVNHNSASRNGEPFEELIRARKFLPNQVARFCTAELKVRPPAKYVKRECGWAGFSTCLGIRADEAHRAKQPKEGKGIVGWFPMVPAGATKRDVVRFWKAQPFDLRLQNIGGRTPLGNCDGCFLKSEANQAMLAREYPERHAWWERMETIAQELTSGTGGQFRPGYSKKSLREFVEKQGDWIFDSEGALCQADGGECVI